MKRAGEVGEGKFPGVTKQSALFPDNMPHQGPITGILQDYCFFAAIYHKSPVGLDIKFAPYPIDCAKYVPKGKVELFNLRKDVGEKNDLSSEMPEKVAELKDLLARWRKSVGAQMPVRTRDLILNSSNLGRSDRQPIVATCHHAGKLRKLGKPAYNESYHETFRHPLLRPGLGLPADSPTEPARAQGKAPPTDRRF